MHQIDPPTTQQPITTPEGATKAHGRKTATGGLYMGRKIALVVFALALSVINDYWLVQLEVVRYSFATYAAPFYNCLFTLLVLTALNALVKRSLPARLAPWLSLSRGELLTMYVMVSISSAICSTNCMQILVALMGYAHFFKSPENQWGPLFADRLPHWLTVSDQASLRNFYYGNSTLYTPANYAPWIVPVLCWSAFAAALLWTMLCFNSILRKQWTEAERLTFPIVVLPLEMTQESGELFKNRYFWLGFAIAGVITAVAGLHYLYPSIPYIRIVRVNIGQYLTQPPWNAMGAIPMGFYFWAIGIAFLMPLELSISCWVFFWLLKLELVMATSAGWNRVTVPGGGFDSAYPFIASQSYGAYLGFFAMSIWASRHYLARVFRTAFMNTKEVDETNEAISYRAAIMGAVLGLLSLAWFGRAIGMTAWVVMVFFIFYFIFAIIISRIRAELGFPTHDMHGMGPQHMLLAAAGTRSMDQQNLVGFSLLWWLNRTYASHPSPHQMEALKLAERTHTSARQMFFAVVIASIFAVPIGFWMLLHIYFHNGGATSHMEVWAMGFGVDCWATLEDWMKNPFGPNHTAMGFVGVGFMVSMLMGWMRMRFLWFPFHPLAYAMAPSWGFAQLWMPIMIGSTIKSLMLKFGGLRTYRAALPFFFGLILGEIAVGSLWTIIGIALGIPTYDFWPGKYG